jgi:hypothetical protein
MKRYCGKPQLYQGLVQYTIVKAFCSALAARSSASSETSNVRISASVSTKSFASLSMAPTALEATRTRLWSSRVAPLNFAPPC